MVFKGKAWEGASFVSINHFTRRGVATHWLRLGQEPLPSSRHDPVPRLVTHDPFEHEHNLHMTCGAVHARVEADACTAVIAHRRPSWLAPCRRQEPRHKTEQQLHASFWRRARAPAPDTKPTFGASEVQVSSSQEF